LPRPPRPAAEKNPAPLLLCQPPPSRHAEGVPPSSHPAAKGECRQALTPPPSAPPSRWGMPSAEGEAANGSVLPLPDTYEDCRQRNAAPPQRKDPAPPTPAVPTTAEPPLRRVPTRPQRDGAPSNNRAAEGERLCREGTPSTARHPQRGVPPRGSAVTQRESCPAPQWGEPNAPPDEGDRPRKNKTRLGGD
jgi:hypothetical protein